MGITYSEIQTLLGRKGNELVHKQINEETGMYDGKILPRVQSEGVSIVVNVKTGGIDATGWIPDGGTLPEGGYIEPVQGTDLAKVLFTRLDIPRLSAKLAKGKKEGVKILLENIQSSSSNLARRFSSACFSDGGHTLAAAGVASVGGGTPQLTVPSYGQYRIGDVLDRWGVGDGASVVLQERLRITNVTIDADGVSHVLFLTRNIDSSLPNETLQNADVVYLRGERPASAYRMNNLSDVNAAGSLHGISDTVANFSGNLETVTGGYPAQRLRDLWTKVSHRRGKSPDCVVSSMRVQQLYVDDGLDLRRWNVDDSKFDERGNPTIEFKGRPWKVEHSCPTTDVFFLPPKGDIELHIALDFQTDGDGEGPHSKMHGQVSQTKLAYDYQIWGAMNMIANRRNGCARITGIGTT